MWRSWPICAILAAVGLAPAAAHADARREPLPLELEWSAPRQCPPASFVIQHVEQLVRDHLEPSPKIVANARVERAAGGRWRLELTLRTGGVEQTRALEGSSCAAVAEACAVVIALAIDASAEGHAPPEAHGPPPAAPGPPPEAHGPPPATRGEEVPAGSLAQHPPSGAPPSSVRAAPIELRSSASPLTPPTPLLAIGLGAALSSGPLPKPGAGLLASASLRVRRFRVGVLATGWARQSPTFAGPGGASFDMFEAGVSAAYMVPLGWVAVGPGADLEATYMRVQGFGIRAPRASKDLWLTPVFGGRLEARATSRLGLFARADALVPIAAPRYVLATSSEGVQLHEPSRIGLRLSLGVEIVIP